MFSYILNEYYIFKFDVVFINTEYSYLKPSI